MEGVSRIIHQNERDVLKVLHPKVVPELPKFDEVMGLLNDHISEAHLEEEGLDVRLGYFFSSRRDAQKRSSYETARSVLMKTRRQWAIVAYPLEGEAFYISRSLLIGDVTWGSTKWHQNAVGEEDRYIDPMFFTRFSPENSICDNEIFVFRKDPLTSGRKYLRDIQGIHNGICLPYFM